MANGFWRTLLRFDASKITPEVGLRNTIGIVLPLIAGVALGYTSAGVVASLGALNVSYSDSRDPYAIRARRMLLASLMVALAVAIGALSAVNSATAVVAATLWALATGMLVVLGSRAGDLGAVTLVTLIVFAARSLTPLEALESALLAFGGGVLQTILSVALWPVNPYQPERRILASVYQSLADIAISPTGPAGAPPATVSMNTAQDAANSLSQDSSAEAERLSFLVNQAERIRLSLLGLRRLRQRIARDSTGAEVVAAIDRLLSLTAEILRSVSQSVAAGHGVPRLAGLSDLVGLFRKGGWDTSNFSPELRAMKVEARYQVEVLAGQLRAASGLTSAGAVKPPPSEQDIPVLSENAPARLIRLYANLSVNSTAFRHALRLAVCVGLGDALGRAVSLQRGYWLPMTVAIVLKPDFTATFSRGILRMAGTLAGLVLATGLFHFLHSGPGSDIAMITIFVLILRVAGPGISGIAVLLIAMTGISPYQAMVARGVNTTLGGILSLAAWWVWPTWERTQAGPVVATMLQTYREYFHAVMAVYMGSSAASLDSLRLAARLARSNAEASVARVGSEPGAFPEEKALLNAILVSSHTFVRAAMALESGTYRSDARPTSENEALKDFCSKTETTLGALVDSLAHGQPVPADLADLREAWAAMNDTSRHTLLEMETDRLTTSLNTLREQVMKWGDQNRRVDQYDQHRSARA
jgi:uncharacterized membrane protein YccC